MDLWGYYYYHLGHKIIAAAFTKVSPEERRSLWLSLYGATYGFDLNKLNSKIRHKLRKLNIFQLEERELSKGESLNYKFSNKIKK